jgi:hypothetical protein
LNEVAGVTETGMVRRLGSLRTVESCSLLRILVGFDVDLNLLFRSQNAARKLALSYEILFDESLVTNRLQGVIKTRMQVVLDSGQRLSDWL